MNHQDVGCHRVACLGKLPNYRINDWSDPSSFFQLAESLRGLGLDSCCIVRPSFGGQVAEVPQLEQSYNLAGGSINTSRHVSADALLLPPGTNGAIAPADCPTLILSNIETGEAAILHCGRDALLPRDRRLNPEGEFYGVIENSFPRFHWEPLHIRAGIFLGVGSEHFSHPFSHPVFGDRNRQLVNFVIKSYNRDCIQGDEENGCIDLLAIIKHKLARQGLKEYQICHDGIDTAGPENASTWWSVRRDGDIGRNLIIVRPLT